MNVYKIAISFILVATPPPCFVCRQVEIGTILLKVWQFDNAQKTCGLVVISHMFSGTVIYFQTLNPKYLMAMQFKDIGVVVVGDVLSDQ